MGAAAWEGSRIAWVLVGERRGKRDAGYGMKGSFRGMRRTGRRRLIAEVDLVMRGDRGRLLLTLLVGWTAGKAFVG